jgi:hypothetical protein
MNSFRIWQIIASLLLLCCIQSCKDDEPELGPAINIPNTIVKATWVNDPNINTNGDDEIQEREATNYTGEIIIAPNQAVDDLTGIEYFVNITLLRVTNNSLTELDVSANTLLEELYCTNNSLTSLDLSNNIALKELYIGGNDLSSIDLSTNNALELLWCGGNDFTTLNLTSNTALNQLICKDNQLTALNLSANITLSYLQCQNNLLSSLNLANGNNTNFTYFDALRNTNLQCVQIDDGFTTPSSWKANDNTNFDPDC